LLKGFNDLATTHPRLAAQADGWDPKSVFSGSGTVRNWKCELGHAWRTTPNSRTNHGELGCPYCGNQKVWPGFNDLATTHPHLLPDVDGWDPTIVSAGSAKRVRWICSEGHRWKGRLTDRKAGTGCPTCAKYGFDPNKEGYLYLLEHALLEMFQIGITNVPKQRLEKHGRGGWTLMEIRGPSDGHLTRLLESATLLALEKRGAIRGHKSNIEKFDGHTESWTKKSLNVTCIKQILDWVYEDEAK